MLCVDASEATTALCPVCDGDVVPWQVIRGYRICECIQCGCRFVPGPLTATFVAETFDDRYFYDGGAGYPDYLGEGSILRRRGRRYGRLAGRHTVPGRVLDVGAAAGFILRGFTDHGWSGVGLEPNRRMAAYGQTELGLDIRIGTLEEFDTDEQFDLVTMVQSMMHFFDLHRACRVAADLTRDGGLWLIEAFDPRSMTARLFGTAWHDYNPPSVRRWLSPDALRLLVARYGFVEVARRRSGKVISAAHAKSALDFDISRSPHLRPLGWLLHLLPDGMALPYPGDDVFVGIYKKVGDRCAIGDPLELGSVSERDPSRATIDSRRPSESLVD